ncbi:MAG: hypothetical protein WBG86_10410 [Polyangiales bacterium]
MTRTELCLRWALAGCVALSVWGCDNPTRSGPPNDVLFFGRLAETYQVCFYMEESFESLVPSTACDRDGETALSFNIEVAAGTDPNGDPCTFEVRVDEPIPTTFNAEAESWQFAYPPDAGVETEIIGTLNADTSTGQTVAQVVVEGMEADCTVVWTATPDPVCRDAEFVRCERLSSCCDSIYLLPSELLQCNEVVSDCDPFACEALLAGYTQCPQPPVCTLPQDPMMECQMLEDCCNTADLTKDELVSCLDTAEACDPSACESLRNDTAQCAEVGDQDTASASPLP